MATPPSSIMRLGGSMEVTGGQKGRLTIGPLLPGDQVQRLKIQATGPSGTPAASPPFYTVRLKSSGNPPLDDSTAFDALPDLVLREIVYARWFPTAADFLEGYKTGDVESFLLLTIDLHRRYLTIEVAADADLNAQCSIQVFRPASPVK